MSFLKILVPVNGGARDASVLETAFALAQPFKAHVMALFVRVDPTDVLPFGELPLSPDFAQELVDAAADVELVAANSARSILAEAAAKANVKLVGEVQRCDTASASYHEMTGYLPQVLSKVARLCDVVVFPEIRETDAHDISDGLYRVLVKAACPVLLSGSSPLKAVGHKVAIGWDNGVACARAMVAALPLLRLAEKIEILSVTEKSDADTEIGEALAYLALHGVSATGHMIARKGKRVAEALLGAAGEGECDMIVIGGYSRGRMTEAMFGGVTQDIIWHAPMPTFMLH